MVWDQRTGIAVNNYYHGAKPIMHLEAPDTQVIFVETDDSYGPYGAKTIGEIGIVPAVGAVANAVFHATGIRVRELPITPDRILTALRKGEGRKA